MSSIKTTQIDGDVSIGRNVAIGGMVTVKGTTHFNGRVRVEGWLDAPNIKGPCRGFFETEEALNLYNPRPLLGWWALVLASDIERETDDDGNETVWAYIYIAHDWAWHNTGKPASIEVELTSIENRLDAVEEMAKTSAEIALDAKKEAEDAMDTAKTAEANSQQAAETANEAKTIAQTAETNSENAVTIANQAVTTANEAKDTANEAKTIAEEALENSNQCGILPFKGVYNDLPDTDGFEVGDIIWWGGNASFEQLYNFGWDSEVKEGYRNSNYTTHLYRCTVDNGYGRNTLYRWEKETGELVRLVDETDLAEMKTELEKEIAETASEDSGILPFNYWVEKEETIYDIEAKVGEIAWVVDSGDFLQMNEYGGWANCQSYNSVLNDVLFRLKNTLYYHDAGANTLVPLVNVDLSPIENNLTIIEQEIADISIYPFDGIVDTFGETEYGKIIWVTDEHCFYKGEDDEGGGHRYVKVYEDVLDTALFRMGNELYRLDGEVLVRLVDESDLVGTDIRYELLD